MFKSIIQSKTTYENNKYLASYIIKDDDFQEEIIAVYGGSKSFGRTRAVIEVYKKRNLDIIGNIIFSFKFNEDEFGLTILEQMIQNKEYNKEYLPYHNQIKDELDKYLDLCSNRFPKSYKKLMDAVEASYQEVMKEELSNKKAYK
jgi:hypothetical protein